jgi:hypothetical protein
MQRFRNAALAGDPVAMAATLAEDVVFHSPIVFRPIVGRGPVMTLLRAVMEVFRDFHYVSELHGDGGRTALEFRAKVGDREIHGIDLGVVGADGLITELTVFVRPFAVTQAFAETMRAKLGPK